jgi:hypothetical protein
MLSQSVPGSLLSHEVLKPLIIQGQPEMTIRKTADMVAR